MFIDALFTRTRIALPFALSAVLIFLSAAGPVLADPLADPVADQPTISPADPPQRVGRLSYVDGTVSFHAADQDQWSPAVLNFPVTSGNSFWTEANSRAEIEIGPVEIRMDQTTAVDITKLDDTGTQVEVEQGIVNVHLNTLPSGGVTVVTPRGNVMLLQPGSYHIDAGHPNGDTPAPTDQVQVSVLEGKAELDGPRSSLDVGPGETAVESGDPTSFTLSEGNSTPFDDWALSRERSERALATPSTSSPTITWNGPRVAPSPSPTLQYVSPQVTGYQDLDTYGSWNTTPDYGAVWYPTQVAVDWAPYRYGHWAFIAPWGWTWIDDAPWGFAPFHYGRWVQIHDRWGWCPGEIVARPVYAPALVAFIGGSNFGISISIGHSFPAVGWVPLGPREVFHPWYHASPTYVRNVNITNVTVVNNITVEKNVTVNNFVNQQAATVVSASAFTGAAPVGRARISVAREDLAQARVRPQLTHLDPTPAARAGIAVQEAATVDVPKPGTPARIVTAPAAAPNAQPPQTEQATERQQVPAAFTVPKSPGPTFHGRAARPAVSTATPGGASTPAAIGAAQPSNRGQPQNAPQVETGPAPESQTKPLPEVVHGPPPIRHGENQGTMSNGTTPNASPSTPGRANLQAQPGPKAEPQATMTPNTSPNASMPNAATHNAAPGPEIRHSEQPVPQSTMAPSAPAIIHHEQPVLGSTPTPSSPAITRHEQAIQGSTPTPSSPATTRHEQAIQGSTPKPTAAPEVVHGSPAREAVQAAPTPKVESAPAPAAEIRHPAQSTHLAPTVEGWKRQAGPPAAVAKTPEPPAPKAAAPEIQKKAEPATQQSPNRQGPQDHGPQDRGPNKPGQFGQ